MSTTEGGAPARAHQDATVVGPADPERSFAFARRHDRTIPGRSVPRAGYDHEVRHFSLSAAP